MIALTLWAMAAYIAANLILRAITDDKPGTARAGRQPLAIEGESPIQVKINPVEVGTEKREVEVPTIRVRDGNQAAPAAANTQ